MRRRLVGLLLVALWVVLAACSKDDDSSASTDAVGADSPSGGENLNAAEDAGGQGSARSDAPASAAAGHPLGVDPGRIVYQADLAVRVEDPSAASREALDLVERAGGSLASQNDAGSDVTLVVRIPVDRFRPTLDAVADLGVELHRTLDAEDVTDQVVDLEVRLATARASADRLRELYADAADVNQIVTIEKALTEREAEVEALAGRLQSLEDRADRSTLTVSFVKVGEPAEVEPEDDASLFVRGLRRGWDTVTALGGAVSAVAGFLVPLLPFVAVIGAVAAVVRARTQTVRRGRSLPE